MKEGCGCCLRFSLEGDLIASGAWLTLNIKPASPHLLGGIFVPQDSKFL